MTAYYNEFDPFAAQWLRNLIDAGHIAPGVVDDRSIADVTASDLTGFTQCHFFAGIGGWSYALRLAGIPDDFPCWTGSPPCQPFSVAGKQLGQLDERHLAPTFMRLVDQCRPPVLFGEQVAAAIGKHWLDDLFAELERQGYACGAAVLPAASVGAPHKRDRLFFGAHRLAHAGSIGWNRGRNAWPTPTTSDYNGRAGGMADTNDTRPQGRSGVPERADQQPPGASGVAGRMDNAVRTRRQTTGRNALKDRGWQANDVTVPGEDACGGVGPGKTDPHNCFWSDADWLGCRDGKFRPVEPGTFPLANGVPARVGRLRGYGNAIVPQVAAEFIKAFTGAIHDSRN